MSCLTMNHMFMIPNQENNLLLFLYYLFTWILCHQQIPSFHDVQIVATPGRQTVQCASDHFDNIHFAVLPSDYNVRINPDPDVRKWNNKDLFHYLRKLIKKLEQNYPNIVRVLRLFLQNEFSMMKKSQKHFRKLKQDYPDVSTYLPWFEGFFIIENDFDNTKYERFREALKPLTQQIEKNQVALSNIIYTSIRAHMDDLHNAVHHDTDMADVILQIKKHIHFELNTTFHFVQTKDVDFRELILHFYDMYLDFEEIENQTLSFVVKLQVLFSLLPQEKNRPQKKINVETNGTAVESLDFSEMCKIHPFLRSTMTSDFCKLNYSLVQ